MFVRTLRRKTTKNVSVQIVHGYRNEQGQPRLKIIRHMGSAPAGEALQALLDVAALELHRMKEKQQPSLFPATEQREPDPVCPQASAGHGSAAHSGCTGA